MINLMMNYHSAYFNGCFQTVFEDVKSVHKIEQKQMCDLKICGQYNHNYAKCVCWGCSKVLKENISKILRAVKLRFRV